MTYVFFLKRWVEDKSGLFCFFTFLLRVYSFDGERERAGRHIVECLSGDLKHDEGGEGYETVVVALATLPFYPRRPKSRGSVMCEIGGGGETFDQIMFPFTVST